APNAHFGVAVTADPGDLEEPPPPPPPPAPGHILFATDFENDVIDAVPSDGWTSTSGPVSGTAHAVSDAANDFGAGEENKFLHVESANSLTLRVAFEGTDLLTLSYDYIGRIYESDGSRAMNLNLRTSSSSNNDRVHVAQMNPTTGLIDTVSFG